MCVIASCVKRMLTAQEIKNCWAVNDDGAGIGWFDGKSNHYRKGFMTLKEFKRFYFSAKLPLPHVVHFRLASAGGVNPQLCHPFPVDLTAPVNLRWSGKVPLLFHNGTVGEWKNLFLHWLPEILRELRRRHRLAVVPSGPWSDTRVVATIAGLAGTEILQFISGGKFAVFDRGKVTFFGDFFEENGVFFSNFSFKSLREDHDVLFLSRDKNYAEKRQFSQLSQPSGQSPHPVA